MTRLAILTNESLPEDKPFNHSWFSSIVYAIRVRITLANNSTNTAPTHSLEEIASYLLNDRLIRINVFSSKPVRLSDPNHASCLACQLEAMSGRSNVLLTYGNKSFLFLSHDNDSKAWTVLGIPREHCWTQWIWQFCPIYPNFAKVHFV